jgi:hypothetical protein
MIVVKESTEEITGRKAESALEGGEHQSHLYWVWGGLRRRQDTIATWHNLCHTPKF